MQGEYIPAIITALAGIFGIFINVSVNSWYRYSDSRYNLLEKDIEAYEKFFCPLLQQIIVFESRLENLSELCGNRWPMPT